MGVRKVWVMGMAVLTASCVSAGSESVGSGVSATTASSDAVDLAIVAARAAHSSTTLADGRVFVAGGCVVDGCATATTETFLLSADGRVASTARPMRIARDSHTANLVPGGKVVLAGGYPGEGLGVTTSVEVIDPASGTDLELDLRQGRGGHAAVVVGTGQVIFLGGWIRSHTYTSTVEMVDPVSAEVVSLPDLPWAADALDATVLADGRVLVTGGQVAPGRPTDEAALYDPTTESWTPVGPMTTPRLKHFSVLLSDGRVLVMGGDIGGDTITDATEIFDPETFDFAPGPRLSEPRYKFPGGALLVDEHRVLIAAGGATTELLDLETGVGRILSAQVSTGSFATLNRLGSGDYVVIGGYDERIDLRRTVSVIAARDVFTSSPAFTSDHTEELSHRQVDEVERPA